MERRAVTVRVRRGGSGGSTRREDEPKRLRTNFSFRRVSEVMEGVRIQGIRATTSKNNLTVSSGEILRIDMRSRWAITQTI